MSLTSVPTSGACPLPQPRRRLLERLGAAPGDDHPVRRREALGDRVADAGGAAADECVVRADAMAASRGLVRVTVYGFSLTGMTHAEPTMSPSQWDECDRDGGLDRAAAILGAFDAAHRELTLAALVARCGLPRSTTHRTADRMIRLGWLEKPGGRYRIGNRLFEIASLAPIRLELREAVAPLPAGPAPGHEDHRAARRARRHASAGRREDHRAPGHADAVAGRRA